jgi:hypothetical protein
MTYGEARTLFRVQRERERLERENALLLLNCRALAEVMAELRQNVDEAHNEIIDLIDGGTTQ